MISGEIYLVSDKLDLATGDDVVAAEATFGGRFPEGYKDYVTSLGAGDYTDYVRVSLPSQVLNETMERRAHWAEFATDFYGPGLAGLPLSRLLESVVLASTIDGDELVFHPDAHDELFVLPRHDVRIYKVGGTLEDALEWFLESGTLRQKEETLILMPSGDFTARRVRYFESYADRSFVEFTQFGELAYGMIRSFLVSAAHDQRGETMCVIHSRAGEDGSPSEWTQLFVKEYAGVISCIPYPEDQGGMTVTVTHDSESRAERLVQMLDYFGRVAASRIDSSEDGSPVWDRDTREWHYQW